MFFVVGVGEGIAACVLAEILSDFGTYVGPSTTYLGLHMRAQIYFKILQLN